MKLSRYVKIFPDSSGGSFILYSTITTAVFSISPSLLEALKKGELPPEQEQLLASRGFLVEDAADERDSMLSWFRRINERSTRFNPLVILNLDCNLACTYCYEHSVINRRRMSESTADLLCEVLVRDHLEQGRDLFLTFYGGEPLLTPDLISRIGGRLASAAAALGRMSAFTMVTNGTLLTRPTVESFLPIGMQGAKITLDGPREVHDASRAFRSGKGSFDLIAGNAAAVADLIALQIGGNYTRDNWRRFPELLDFLPAAGLPPERVSSVKFDPVTPRVEGKGISDFGCGSSEEGWMIEAAIVLREEILRRGYHTPKPRPASCMVEYDGEVAVNWDGTLYKCPAFVGWKGMEAGSLETGLADLSAAHGMDIWKSEQCLECEYLPLCFGGCRFLRLLAAGTIDAPDCRKTYLDAALEKMVTQDLRLRR